MTAMLGRHAQAVCRYPAFRLMMVGQRFARYMQRYVGAYRANHWAARFYKLPTLSLGSASATKE